MIRFAYPYIIKYLCLGFIIRTHRFIPGSFNSVIVDDCPLCKQRHEITVPLRDLAEEKREYDMRKGTLQ
jgi:hypothetical protein